MLTLLAQVKQPMDMSTVVIKLLTGEYGNEGGMVADLRLMLANCRRCVPTNSLLIHTCSIERSVRQGQVMRLFTYPFLLDMCWRVTKKWVRLTKW